MITTKTPYRISFFGGGTDYPSYYSSHPGAVLATTIDKYCYINLRELPPFFEHKHRIVWSIVETVQSFDDITHPSVRACLKLMRSPQDCGLEIHHIGDLPARTGLGSSSSFTVGLLHALYKLQEEPVSKKMLADKAIYIEQQVLHENVGSQDQTIAAHGGFNLVRFGGGENTHLNITPVSIAPERLLALNARLMLFFTGLSRTASEIAGEQIENTHKNIEQLQAMYELVFKASYILSSNMDLDDFGRLLDSTWKLKRTLSKKISTDTVDGIYKTAISNGALGGKLLGAGGGGFILFYVPPEKQAQVKNALGLLHVPFSFENCGSQVV